LVAVLALLSALAVLSLRWLDPPMSSFMLQHLVSQWLDGRGEVHLYHRWVRYTSLPPQVPLAVVAAEDQRFPSHHGFDLEEIGNALKDYWAGGRLRGASTLSQQLAKNLFLWPGKDLLRKGLELWFTALIELSLPKRRILELYLNVAQFGPHTFGIGMAAERFFHKPAAGLSLTEASLLAAVLPNPRRYHAARPSAHVKKRARWIRGQMKNLGSGYLNTH
jgi:monofunctional biosynthetic peptidoglycan transglycosylase